MERKLGETAPSAATISVLERVVDSTELVDSVTASVQQIAAELRPGVLDKLGPGAALQFEARRFEERTGIPCEVRLAEEEPELTAEQATALYRIVQESLTNVARHARARRAVVTLGEEEGKVVLTVEDDGRGIGTGDIARPEALGLLGMKERAEQLGGAICFQNHPGGKGTVVTVRIPHAGKPAQRAELEHAGINN
jgi:signal transduction histidine kinase